MTRAVVQAFEAAYKTLSSSLRSCLDASSFISGMAQARTADFSFPLLRVRPCVQGESSWTMSRECLLASLGLPKTVWHVPCQITHRGAVGQQRA